MIRNELAPVIELDGCWDFRILEETVSGKITVPDCWEAQGYPKTLDGPVVYRRTVHIPSEWAGQPVFLEFDAVSYAANVYSNGVPVGEHVGLWTPFAVELTQTLKPGTDNLLEIEVVKPCHRLIGGRFPMRTTLAGFLPDVATTFGGLWQSVRLRLLSAGVDDLQIDADPTSGTVRVRGRPIVNGSVSNVTMQVAIEFQGRPVAECGILPDIGGPFDLQLTVPSVQAWQLDRPALYTVHLEIFREEQPIVAVTERLGFRRLSADGEKLLLNGDPITLRGVLSWGWHPSTIAPVYTREQVQSEIRGLRKMGFNLVKLCLFVPNQTYYDIADEEGMLLWQEWPMWLPEITEELRTRAPGEYAELMKLTRYHPSVVLYSLGCELDRHVDQALLKQLDAVVRESAKNTLVCDNSGSGEAYGGAPIDLADFSDYHTYGELHFLEATLDHWRRDWQQPRPLIFGEFCDSDGFRDRGAVLEANDGKTPWWMTQDNPTYAWRPEVQALVEMEQRLDLDRLDFTHQQLVDVANAQSLMVRKFTLETVRKRRQVQGYVVTGLRDTPIATSGLIDDFEQPKWDEQTFRHFNDDAILCLDVGRSRIWQHGGDRAERLDCYNWRAGEPIRLHLILNQTVRHNLDGGWLCWRVTDSEDVVASGEKSIRRFLPGGAPAELSTVALMAPEANEALSLQLDVHFQAEGVECRNRWPLWVYPRQPHFTRPIYVHDSIQRMASSWDKIGQPWPDEPPVRPDGLVITSELDPLLEAFLHGGGRVLLLQVSKGSLPVQRLPFWREAIKLLSPHPLWERFPNDGFVDLQFFGLATDTAFDVGQIAGIPDIHDYRPLLRRLDARQFTVNDYLFEASVGKGRLVACSLRLHGGAGMQPTGLKRNVAGLFLLDSLIDLLL